jgi:hypothetical protein
MIDLASTAGIVTVPGATCKFECDKMACLELQNKYPCFDVQRTFVMTSCIVSSALS